MGKFGSIWNHGRNIGGPHGHAGLPLFGAGLMQAFTDHLYAVLSGLELSWLRCDRSQGLRAQQPPIPEGAVPLLLPVEARRRQRQRPGGYGRF